MSEVYKACGIAIIAVVCAVVLKRLGSSVAPYVSQVAAVVIFIGAISALMPFMSFIFDILNGVNTDIKGISTLFTAAAIAVISGIISDICKENGELMLKNAVDFAANAEILLLSVPIITQILTSITEILKI